MTSVSAPNHRRAVFHKVGQNLYRLESSGAYYALIKRAGKQIRRSLKTSDAALARRRLSELRDKVSRLNTTKGVGKITFSELAERWLSNHRVRLKEKSISRLDICLKGLQPFIGSVPIRNISTRHCEEWLTRRGKIISLSPGRHSFTPPTYNRCPMPPRSCGLNNPGQIPELNQSLPPRLCFLATLPGCSAKKSRGVVGG